MTSVGWYHEGSAASTRMGVGGIRAHRRATRSRQVIDLLVGAMLEGTCFRQISSTGPWGVERTMGAAHLMTALSSGPVWKGLPFGTNMGRQQGRTWDYASGSF